MDMGLQDVCDGHVVLLRDLDICIYVALRVYHGSYTSLLATNEIASLRKGFVVHVLEIHIRMSCLVLQISCVCKGLLVTKITSVRSCALRPLRPATSANCELFVNLANQNMEYRPKTVS